MHTNCRIRKRLVDTSSACVRWAHTCGFLWCELTTNHKNIVSSHCPYAISRQLGWCRSVSPSSAEMTVLVWAHTNQRQNKKISKSEKNLYVGLRSKSYWRNQKELKKFVRSSTAAGQSKKRCEVTHCTDRHTLLISDSFWRLNFEFRPRDVISTRRAAACFCYGAPCCAQFKAHKSIISTATTSSTTPPPPNNSPRPIPPFVAADFMRSEPILSACWNGSAGDLRAAAAVAY